MMEKAEIPDDEYREYIIKQLHEDSAWAKYYAGSHVICPVCFASIYYTNECKVIKLAHITWHERNNI